MWHKVCIFCFSTTEIIHTRSAGKICPMIRVDILDKLRDIVWYVYEGMFRPDIVAQQSYNDEGDFSRACDRVIFHHAAQLSG